MENSFEVLSLVDAVFKVDIFVAKDDDFTQQQLARRRAEKITPDSSQQIYVATAEDTILAKLSWYRSGGEASRVQWSDMLGIVGTQGSGLDLEYMRDWAALLNLLDLLERLLEEAGLA